MIAPDYARPAALMVPHAPLPIIETLEAVASEVAKAVGVILLSTEPRATEQFVARQSDPERFSIVAAEFDSPWIRDRSPVPVRARSGYRWVLPRLRSARPRDDRLFSQIVARDFDSVDLVFLRGNLIAGPRGLALSTQQIYEQNDLSDRSPLVAAQKSLGIRRWLFVPQFPHESSGHVDVCARFLSPGLLAVAWNPDRVQDQEVALDVEDKVTAVVPELRVIRLPMRTQDRQYASPVNWIQIGKLLLVPRYPITPAEDVVAIETALTAEGFQTRFVDSPTAEYGGALHCLTASVFV